MIVRVLSLITIACAAEIEAANEATEAKRANGRSMETRIVESSGEVVDPSAAFAEVNADKDTKGKKKDDPSAAANSASPAGTTDAAAINDDNSPGDDIRDIDTKAASTTKTDNKPADSKPADTTVTGNGESVGPSGSAIEETVDAPKEVMVPLTASDKQAMKLYAGSQLEVGQSIDPTPPETPQTVSSSVSADGSVTPSTQSTEIETASELDMGASADFGKTSLLETDNSNHKIKHHKSTELHRSSAHHKTKSRKSGKHEKRHSKNDDDQDGDESDDQEDRDDEDDDDSGDDIRDIPSTESARVGKNDDDKDDDANDVEDTKKRSHHKHGHSTSDEGKAHHGKSAHSHIGDDTHNHRFTHHHVHDREEHPRRHQEVEGGVEWEDVDSPRVSREHRHRSIAESALAETNAHRDRWRGDYDEYIKKEQASHQWWETVRWYSIFTVTSVIITTTVGGFLYFWGTSLGLKDWCSRRDPLADLHD